MATISAEQAGGANVLAFLDMIARSEIGPGLLAVSDDGYNVLVGSTPDHPLLFDDYSRHPRIRNEKMNSDAAGRYQLMGRYYEHYRALLGLDGFYPASQDRIAIQQIKEFRAIPLILAGELEAAIRKCSPLWASFPGAGYGQHEHKFYTLLAAYQTAGGSIA